MLLCKRCRTAGTVLRRFDLTPSGRRASSAWWVVAATTHAATPSTAPSSIPTSKPPSQPPSTPSLVPAPGHPSEQSLDPSSKPLEPASRTSDPRAKDSHLGHNARPKTNRYAKRRASSPSKALIAALELAQQFHALPVSRQDVGKLDLSYFNVRTADSTRWLQERQRETGQFGRRATAPPASPQTILAQYIVHQASQTQDPFKLNQKETEILRSRGYTLEDVAAWASIVTAQSSIQGAREMLTHTDALQTDLQSKMTATKTPLPHFVFLFFLRRPIIHPKALKDLIAYAWWIIRQRQRLAHDHSPHAPMDDSTCFIATVRLIRQARKALPEAIFSVVRFFIKYMDQRNAIFLKTREMMEGSERLSQTTYLYNTVLDLLSTPSSANAFLHAPTHQRAQFEIVKSMAQHSPPLCISRDGYQAIARVQLANKKTAQEADWAQLKKKSWPPWKEDRTGLDADKDREYGTSRALEAMQRGIEAGYGSLQWENAAKILSGWDIDGSPTIQTRAMLPGWRRKSPSGSRLEPSLASVWMSRIRATRTLAEAWAAFLGWREQRSRPHAGVYFFMLQKIAAESKRVGAKSQAHDQKTDALPGDSLEVQAPPMSDGEGVYVREAPPSFDALAEDMHLSGVFPGNEPRLAYLITHASSFEDQIKYLQWASEKDDVLAAMFQHDWDVDELRKVNVQVLTAFLMALCDAAQLGPAKKALHDERFARPFRTAMRLIAAYKPQYAPAWVCMISALGGNGPLDQLSGRESQVPRWKLMRDLLEQMQALDLPSSGPVLLAMCRRLENMMRSTSALSACNIGAVTITPSAISDARIRDAIESGVPFVRAQMRDLYGSMRVANLRSKAKGDSQLKPGAEAADPDAPMQHRIDLALLHAYLRVQGFLGAWQELVAITTWMVARRHQINAVRDGLRNGGSMLRKCLVVVRVSCEGFGKTPSEQSAQDASPSNNVTASPRIRKILQKTVDEAEGWGGWPSDSECLNYVNGEREDKRGRG